MHQLESVIKDVTPKLDLALANGPINDRQFLGPSYELPHDLKRRGGICHAASWLLMEILRNEDVQTMSHAKMGEIHIRDKRYITHHMMLKMLTGGGESIDPTYQQFYRYVGLTSEIANQHTELSKLYPDNDIAIIRPGNTEFQENFAESAHRIESELTKVGLAQGILVGTTLDEKVATYKQVWDLSTYKRSPQPHDDLDEAVMRSVEFSDQYELSKG